MATNADFLARQIGVLQAAIARPFDPDPVANAKVVQATAAYLDAAGTTDVRNLRWYQNAAADLAFFFDIATAHVFANPLSGTTQSNGTDLSLDHLLFWNESSDQDYRVYVVFSNDGFPIFVATRHSAANGWADSFKSIAGLAAIAVSLAIPGLGLAIGNAVLGADLAAEYPAVAAALGNVCVSTALNGGDVQSAAIGALSAGVGNGVGGFVATASDSAVLGTAAASVTKAAIVGGNIEQAALQSFVASGVNSASSLTSFQPSAPIMDDSSNSDLNTFNDIGGDSGSGGAPVGDFNLDPTQLDPTQLDTSTGYHDPVWSVNGSAEGATVLAPGATTPPAGPSGVVTSVGGANLTQLALTAIKAVSSWNNAGQPSIRTSNATVRANADGTLTNTNGQVSRMPVGTPYLTANNSLVTNNGDGTYTTVSASGGISTQAYSASSNAGLLGKTITIGGVQISPVVLAAAAIGAVLVLRR